MAKYIKLIQNLEGTSMGFEPGLQNIKLRSRAPYQLGHRNAVELVPLNNSYNLKINNW